MTQRDEVDRNAEAFYAHLPQLLAVYRGKHALMRHQEIINFFDTSRDAYLAGRLLYGEDQLFSIQEVVEAAPSLRPVIRRVNPLEHLAAGAGR